MAINCRAGKGRTGTIICCYLLFCKRFSEPDEVFEYYSKKRFNVGEGVTQPSQRRYVYYFAQMLKEKIYFPYVRNIKAILMSKITGKNSDTFKPYFEIYRCNGDKVSYTNKTSYGDQKKVFPNQNSNIVTITDHNFNHIIYGDLTIKIYNNLILSTKKLGRIAFNTAYLDSNQTSLIFNIDDVDPDNIKTKKSRLF